MSLQKRRTTGRDTYKYMHDTRLASASRGPREVCRTDVNKVVCGSTNKQRRE